VSTTVMQGAAAADAAAPPRNRMAVALLALAGVFVSAYLVLYRVGVLGTLACGVSGGCETVQASKWALFLGVPVAVWGLLGYGALFLLAFAGVQPRFVASRRVAGALLALATGAFAFSIYLSALEAWVIHAWCRWCIASAVIATLLFLAALPEVRRLRRPG